MRKTFKTVAAIALSATMALASYVPAFAGENDPDPISGTGAVYAFAVEEYVVPTSVAFALNPQGLDVVPRTGADAISDQVIARPVGMINKSTRDKVVDVTLELSTDATGESKLTFVNSEDAVEGDTDDFNIYLAVTPAAEAVTKLGDGTTAIDKTTAAAALADVEMTAATGNDIVLAPGDNELAFKLGKATYTLKSGESIALGTDNANDVKNKYELTALGGVTGFTFTGALNENAYWEKNTEKIEVTLTYEIRETSDADEVIDGTGAMISTAPPAPATYTVTYNANYGETPATATETVNADSAPTGNGEDVAALKTREGYSFVGWYDGTGENASAVTLSEIEEATTVYAKWLQTTYTKTDNGSGVDVAFSQSIKSVNWSSDKSEWKTYSTPENYYTIDGSTLKVKDKIFTSPGTRYFKVTLNDDSEVILTFTMD